jgi:hypothetical protein
LGWSKRPDFFVTASKRLAGQRSMLKDAIRGSYDFEKDFVRALLWLNMFEYHQACTALGNGNRDNSIRRDFGVSINTKPMDTTELALELLSYEKTLTFERR